MHWQHGEFSVQFDPEMSTFTTGERSALFLKPPLELAALHLSIINNFVYSRLDYFPAAPIWTWKPKRAVRGVASVVVGVLETSIWRSRRFSPAAKSFNVLADVVRGVGVETKVAVEQKGISVVVELAAAEAALQAERAEFGTRRRGDSVWPCCGRLPESSCRDPACRGVTVACAY